MDMTWNQPRARLGPPGGAPSPLLFLLPLLLATAGCLGTGNVETASPAGSAGTGSGDAPVDRTVRTWNGSLETTVCHPSGIRECTYYSPLGEPSDERRIGNLTPLRELHATLEWTPSSTTTEELVFGIYRMESCGDECTSYSPIREVQGPSPITIETPDLDNGSHRAVVWAPDLGPGPTRAEVVLEQPFTVTFEATRSVGS